MKKKIRYIIKINIIIFTLVYFDQLKANHDRSLIISAIQKQEKNHILARNSLLIGSLGWVAMRPKSMSGFLFLLSSAGYCQFQLMLLQAMEKKCSEMEEIII